jgi:aryl-alcohol dehydrogenase-like predicted oxidoreductase
VKVPDVPLGGTGARVSRLGIGCAYFKRKKVTPDDVRATLHRALELGFTYLDTAPTYRNPETGFAEEKMGPAIAEIRDKVFLVTKTEEPTYEGTWKLLRQSLKRMRTDRVDLVHLRDFGAENLWATRNESSATTGPLPRCEKRSGWAWSGSSEPAVISTRSRSTRRSTEARLTS